MKLVKIKDVHERASYFNPEMIVQILYDEDQDNNVIYFVNGNITRTSLKVSEIEELIRLTCMAS